MTARPYFLLSSSVENNDCLGGHLSDMRFQDLRPVVHSDTIQCLTIDSVYLAERVRVQITKAGNYFEFVLTAYNAATGWVSVTVSTQEIAVGETYTWDFDALYKGGYVTVTRTVEGSDGTYTAYMARNSEPPYMRPDLPVTNTDPYYVCLYLVVPEEQYLYSLDGPYHYAPSLAASSRYVTPIADHWTEPGGASWTYTTAIDGTVAVGTYPVWVKLTEANSLLICFSATPTDYVEFKFHQRTYDTTLKKYRVYGAYDGSVTGGALLGEGNTLPVSVTLTPPGSGTREYRLRLVEQTPYGYESPNQLLDQRIVINATGTDVTAPPAPDSVVVEAGMGKVAYVTATITQPVYGSNIIALIFTIDGTDTEVLVDAGLDEYTVTSDEIDWGDTVSASVVCIDSDLRTSAATTASAAIYFQQEPSPEYLFALHGYYNGTFCRNTQMVGSSDGSVAIFGNFAGTTIYYGNTLIATITDAFVFEAGWTIKNDTVSGASVKMVEDAGSNIFYLGDGVNRRVKFDVANKVLTIPAIAQPIALDCPVCQAVYQHGVYTRFQAFYAGLGRTWLMFDTTKQYMMEIEEST